MKIKLLFSLIIFLVFGGSLFAQQGGCQNVPGQSICFLVSISTLSPSPMPIAGLGIPYSQALTANGATSYSITSGTPTQSGLTLNVGGSASVTGTPTGAGNVSWVLGWSTVQGSFTASVNVQIASVSSVTVSPATANLNSGQTQQFTAQGLFNSPGTDQFVLDVTTLGTWSNTGGSGGCTGSTIGASTGLFTAGSTSGTCLPQMSFQGVTGTATVTVAGSSSNPISFQTSDPLPNGQQYQAYSESASGTNGSLGVGVGVQLLSSCPTCTAPFTWTQTAGTLPTGITLSTSGVLSGTPTTSGAGTSLTFQVADSASHSNSITLASGITVVAASTVTASLTNSTLTANSSTNVSALATYSDSSTAPVPNGMGGAQTYAGVSTAVTSVVSSLQVSPSTSTTTGDFAVGIAASYSSSSLCNAVTATITSPNETFAAATTAQGMVGAPPPYYNCYQMFYAYNITGNAADAPTCNWTATVGSGCLIRYYHGMPTSNPLDQHPTPTKATSVSACTPTAVTTSQANELIELFCGPNSATSISPPSGYGATTLVQGGVPYGLLGDTVVSTIQTSYAPMTTFTPATNEVTLLATFNASAPPNGTVTWASATPTCASVGSSTGIVTAQSVTVSCTAVISPTYYGGSPTLNGATVTVNPSNPDTAIIVKPSSVTVANTGTPSNCVAINCQFTATGNNTGQTYTATWGSANQTVATVNSSSGLASCTSTPGTATINATVSGFSSVTPGTMNCVTASASTINATSCSTADFNTAWSQLGTGAFTGTVIIQLPSCALGGTGTWTSGLTLSVPSSVTNLTVKGNTAVSCTGTPGQSSYICTATDNTVIADNITNGASLLTISTGAPTNFFRMTGITLEPFTSAITSKNHGLFDFYGTTKNFRFDHSDLAGTSNDSVIIEIDGQIEGVFDHDVMTTSGGGEVVNVQNLLFDNVGNADGSWMAATQWGSRHYIYIENSYFNRMGTNCGSGGRIAQRYNTYFNPNNALGAVHSTKDNGGLVRGCRADEYYKNYMSGTATNDATIGTEGSSLLAWGNTAGTLVGNWFFVVDLYRNTVGQNEPATNCHGTGANCLPPNGWGMCGTSMNYPTTPGTASTWDANSVTTNGYPCLDGIGRGQQQDAMNGLSFPNRANTTRGGQVWPHQYLEPIYGWMNTIHSGGAGLLSIRDLSTVANRDIYVDCVASNAACAGGFTGAAGTGFGALSGSQPAGGVARPATCTAGAGGTYGGSPPTFGAGQSYGVAWFAVDTSTLYVCTATNIWTAIYSPYTYPHDLDTGP